MKLMKTDKYFIDILFDSFKKLKKYINELNNLVEEIFNDITKVNENFQKKFLFNKAVFKSYNIYKKNYYSILNIKEFKFDKDEINNLMKLINPKLIKSNKLIVKLHSLNNDKIYKFFIENNSSTYDRKYGLQKILQKFYNDMLKLVKEEKRLIVENTGDLINIYDDDQKINVNKQLDYIFKKKEDNTILGEIKYNNDKNKLIISYFDDINYEDFLDYYILNSFNIIKNNKKYVIKSNILL